MGARGKMHGDLAVPADYVGELVATSLRANSWGNLNYNDLTQEITGEQKKTEKRSGIPWSFDYRIAVSWVKGENGTFKLSVDVHDREIHSMERDCKQLCFDVIKGVASRAETVKESLANAKPRTAYGTARWSAEKDVEAAGYLADEVSGNGLLLGPWEGGRVLAIPEDQAVRHAVICGPTGCGKSSSIFIPNLLERTSVSAIVTEATAGSEPPDLYFKTAGYRASLGHKIYYFNPDDLASVCINPLDQIDVSDPVKAVEKAMDIVDLIMRNTTHNRHGAGDPFWENAERNVLTSLVLHVASEGGDMAQVRRLMRSGAEGLGTVLASSKVAEAREEYQAFTKLATETLRNNVLSGAMQRLSLWLNPKVVALTSKTTIDVSSLPEQLFTFYLAVPAQKEKLKPAAALVFNFLLDLLLEADEKRFKNRCALVLDEFTNFGLIPGFAKKMTIVRHRKIPVMLGMQDYVQLKSVYGDDDATLLFSQPATRVIFRTPDLATAKKTSESLGQETSVDRKLSTTCQVMEREFGRPLMTAAEVMALDPELSLVFTPATDPLKIRRFSWKDYVEKTALPPPVQEEVVIDRKVVQELEKEVAAPPWEEKLEAKNGEPPSTADSSAAESTLAETELADAEQNFRPQSDGNRLQETLVKSEEMEAPVADYGVIPSSLASEAEKGENKSATLESGSKKLFEDDDDCLPI